VIGIVLLVSDHIASFRQERTLIWPLRPSFSKYGFLVNRYLVTLALVALFLPLGGFLGLDFSSRVRPLGILGFNPAKHSSFSRAVGL
jgi:hypothetical protein